MKIAVAGNTGSFSNEAGQLYATGHQLDTVEFIYAIDSPGAFKALHDDKADKCIVPIHNSTGGLVNMTLQAMGMYKFTIDEIFEMKIAQCLMTLPDMKKNDIQRIASHPQALKQCQQYLKTEWPKRALQEYQDTAQAAKDLREGKLSPRTAVIGPKLCAKLYNLEVVGDTIQDEADNTTTFLVISSSDR